jgi:23S rRNA pseudouridine2605 synthase
MAQRLGKTRPDKGKKKDTKKPAYEKFYKKKTSGSAKKAAPVRKVEKTEYSGFDKDGYMRLNKYIAKSGVCSRREADKLIETGAITVNGKIVTEMGHKVHRRDKVMLEGQLLRAEQLHYILLNKPKGFITTTDDPQERKTVMTLVEKATNDRIYPVGRLDMKTTGLLLFTNDGDLAKKLTHPKHNIKKIYHVFLDQPLSKRDMQTIAEGLQLEDGFIRPDAVSYVGTGDDRKSVGIELHSGKNRIVRRIFESLGYKVEKLDRVYFAGLTKKDLPRGRWRHLTQKEVDFLKMI